MKRVNLQGTISYLGEGIKSRKAAVDIEPQGVNSILREAALDGWNLGQWTDSNTR
jgi:hypothetical protein